MESALKAVSNPRRREILRLVWSEELSSRAIAGHFDVSWPAISQNLKVLADAGLIRERRVGTQRLYRADRKATRPIEAMLRRLWEHDLDRLAALAEEEARRKR